MKHVEKFIRHLQSSIEKRKAAIFDEHECLRIFKSAATGFYDEEDVESYNKYAEHMRGSRGLLKELHTIQKTETEMLKWLENIRSCHEELLQKDMQLFDFSLEEEQHD